VVSLVSGAGVLHRDQYLFTWLNSLKLRIRFSEKETITEFDLNQYMKMEMETKSSQR